MLLLIPNLYLIIILATNLFLAIRVWFIYKPDPIVNSFINQSVSIIVPAYNEAVTIVDSVESMLSQSYTNIEIIIINDGSTDGTMDALKQKYNLSPDYILYKKLKDRLTQHNDWNATPFYNVYSYKNIVVIDKHNGGKSTALNMGILLSDAEYVLNVDADTLLRKDAIETTLRKKHRNSDAVSCMIGITNGNPYNDKLLTTLQIPKSMIVRRQWMEYLSAFVLWRAGNNNHNAITVIPGAYGFIKRAALLKVGGYKRDFLAEDGELTMRLLQAGCKIQFIAEFLAWTEVPETVASLQKQRLRWYRGTLQNMLKYSDMVFNKKYSGFLSYFTLPFAWFTDVIGVWVELASWMLLALYIITDTEINWYFLAAEWISIIVVYSLTMGIMLRFVNKKLYPSANLTRLIPIMLIETSTYHFLHLYWLIRSHLNEYLNTKHSWNKFERKGFTTKTK